MRPALNGRSRCAGPLLSARNDDTKVASGLLMSPSLGRYAFCICAPRVTFRHRGQNVISQFEAVKLNPSPFTSARVSPLIAERKRFRKRAIIDTVWSASPSQELADRLGPAEM